MEIYKTDGTLVVQTGDLDTSTSAERDTVLTPVVLDPGYYYFAWAVDNTTAKLAGSGTGTMTGLFNRVPASPGQGTCSQAIPGRAADYMHDRALAGYRRFSRDCVAGFAQ